MCSAQCLAHGTLIQYLGVLSLVAPPLAPIQNRRREHGANEARSQGHTLPLARKQVCESEKDISEPDVAEQGWGREEELASPESSVLRLSDLSFSASRKDETKLTPPPFPQAQIRQCLRASGDRDAL